MTSPDSETRELQQVGQRLQALFPHVRERFIHEVVDSVHRDLAGTAVREVVAVLVEQAATRQLIRRTGQLPIGAAAGPARPGHSVAEII